MIWNWRNREAVGEEIVCEEAFLLTLIPRLKEYMFAEEHNEQLYKKGMKREDCWVSWRKSAQGWFTVNVDGAVRENGMMAAVRGLIRDENGKGWRDFLKNIG